MREILFRGKRWDNGKWVIGDLFQFQDDCIIHAYERGCRVAHSVNPATIGQYTGITDKNGKKIFDGDRVIVPMYRMENPEPNFMKGTVEWRNGAFHVTWDDDMYGRHFLGYLENVEVTEGVV